jgi:hypothetical protein
MPYTINRYSGVELVVLDDGTIDTTTTLGLVGRNYVGYGETQNENFLFLLENFANDFPPARPISGQTWYNTTLNLLNVYDGTQWVVVGNPTLAVSPPENPPPGALWYKNPPGVLYVWDGNIWVLIGPEKVEGFASTKARSALLADTEGINHPVILLEVNGSVIGIVSSVPFRIGLTNPIPGFDRLLAGITMSGLTKIHSDVEGVADRAVRLENKRTINGIGFDGQEDIVITSGTTRPLIRGQFLTGDNFDGTQPVTWGVDAASGNVVGKIVLRNSSGDFSAGTITANLVGNVTGNVTAADGVSTFAEVRAAKFVGATLTGNAFSATKLATGRTINGVFFNGTEDITITADAENLTGIFLNDNVKASSLESVGTLQDLRVADLGVMVGNSSQLKLFIDNGNPTVKVQLPNTPLNFEIVDPLQPGGSTDLNFIPSSISLSQGGLQAPAFIPDTENVTNLGHPAAKWNNVYANNIRATDVYGATFHGNADSATTAVTSTHLAGGTRGAIPYQTAAGSTALLPPGADGQVLQSNASGDPVWGTSFIRGMVMQWYGPSNAVPSGWAVCDGANGTPDLRNKFVIGAGSTYGLGDTGGATSSTSSGQTVSFSGTTANAGSHSHNGVTDGHTITPAEMPAHTHLFTDTYAIIGDYGLGGSTGPVRDRNGTYIYPSFYTNGNASDGDQDNGSYGFPSVTESAGGNQSHDHPIRADGVHSHTVSGTASVSGLTVTTVPPYVALFYIMKL